ncbi:phosphoadenosine phosphosulfate reductase [Pseudophaeobacter flagellatus]|uniref:phosphoadenosine phosphosulfate reductase n=1 Tax=Pseudophaeobacter flagellatus TaxID=2899119 RepID=UPI001E5D8C3C|nr:phosphoadenosine phosphosulfate reductase [Pseudophaeobacter flagellatus]MCD9146483.1 phosphoadenosine phosphosulfate reductase [Pseudophaeobacter flagellatus]
MQENLEILNEDLSGLKPAQWQDRLAALTEELGMFQPLGEKHCATFLDQGDTLLVTFETQEGLHNLSPLAQPLGFEMVKQEGWSHLGLISRGDTWFRDQQVFGFFDQLIDDGFFEEFDKVIFYGAGPCGYAATAFSVASPGATVVAIQPQATLDPRVTEWDDRFVEMRRTSFTDRYGYAPDMLDGAKEAFVFYDPYERLDAMHAALFHRPCVTRLRVPNLGAAVQTRLVKMGLLNQILHLAADGQFDSMAFARLFRARRDDSSYLRALMGRLDLLDRPYLQTLLCRNVLGRLSAPRFRRRLNTLEQRAAEGDFKLPSPL